MASTPTAAAASSIPRPRTRMAASSSTSTRPTTRLASSPPTPPVLSLRRRTVSRSGSRPAKRNTGPTNPARTRRLAKRREELRQDPCSRAPDDVLAEVVEEDRPLAARHRLLLEDGRVHERGKRSLDDFRDLRLGGPPDVGLRHGRDVGLDVEIRDGHDRRKRAQGNHVVGRDRELLLGLPKRRRVEVLVALLLASAGEG